MRYVILFAAGGFGTVCRYLLSLVVSTRTDTHFPWGTLWVNWLGCAAIGLLLGSGLLDRFRFADLRLLLVSGFLGGFTTFSAFAAETTILLESRRPLFAAAYVVFSVLGGIGLCALGYWSVRTFR